MTPHASEKVRRRQTARLLLRVPQAADLGFHAALFALPAMVAHRPVPVPDSREASAAGLARAIEHWQRHGFGRWAIEHEGALVGFGGLTRRADVAPALNISYHLHPTAWGKGLASELVGEALIVAFDVLGAEGVAGLVRPVNVASRRVLERAGFRLAGTLELGGAPTLRLVRSRGDG